MAGWAGLLQARRPLRGPEQTRPAPVVRRSPVPWSELPAPVQRGDVARKRSVRDAGEPGGFEHGGEALWLGKVADRVDQIAVRLGVTGHQTAHGRDDMVGKKIVQAIQTRKIDMGKFEHQDASATAQNPESFGQSLLDLRHIADAKSDGVSVEALVFKG